METPGVVIEELSDEELPEPAHFLRYLPGQASSSGIHRPIALSEGPLHAEDAPPSEEGPPAEEDVQNPPEEAMEPPRKRRKGKQPL